MSVVSRMLAVLIAVAATPMPANADLSWTTEVPDSSDLIGICSLALDMGGNPVIAYTDRNTGTVWIASRVAGQWSVEQAAVTNTESTFVNGASVALDQSSNPHLVFEARIDSTYVVNYASNTTGVWSMETIYTFTTHPNADNYPRLALDANNIPHVAIGAVPNSVVLYGNRTSGAWTMETVESSGGTATCLRLDAGGNIHLAYSYFGKVRYAKRSGGTWTKESTAFLAEGTTTRLSMALDSSAQPHIAHKWNQLNYSTRESGSWASEEIASSLESGTANSIAIDSEDHPHIAYSHTNQLSYAHKNAGIWLTENLDSLFGDNRSVSLALDSNDEPHIARMDGNTLKYLVGGSATSVPLADIRLGFEAFPNPSSGTVTVKYRMGLSETAVLSVHDTSGRLVIRIPGCRVQGSSMQWDGRDDNGMLVPSGVYVLRLDMGKQVESRRITLIH